MTDGRFTLHYLRTTRDGRIALGGGGGRAGFGGRIDGTFTDDARSVRRAAAGLRRLFPSLADVRIEDAWGGPIDISADHLPWVGRSATGRSTTPRLQRQWGRAVARPRARPGGSRAGAADDPALAPIADWSATAVVPARAGPIHRGVGHPRGGLAAGDPGGARRAGRTR